MCPRSPSPSSSLSLATPKKIAQSLVVLAVVAAVTVGPTVLCCLSVLPPVFCVIL